MSVRDSLLAVMVMLIWGANFVVIEVGLNDVPPFFFLALRFALVSLPFLLLVPRPQAPFWVVVRVGVFLSFAQFAFLYLAMALGMPAGLASLLLQAHVLFTILLAVVVLRERPTRRQTVGVVMGAVGLCIVGIAHGATSPIVPLLVMMAAAGSWAVGNVLARRAAVTSGLSMVVWSALVAPVPALALSLTFEGGPAVLGTLFELTPASMVSTLYTVVGASLLGYAIWNTLLARYPAGAVVPFVLLVPIFGILSAWIFLGEVPLAAEAGGGLVMLMGVAVATIGRRAPGVTETPGPAGSQGQGSTG